ncbi:MAG TPA: histidine phosphatase family protein [Acidimicrobiales bacterium]|nr:histidine phosphatase family protein [Acidimicrobiales bacterium]
MPREGRSTTTTAPRRAPSRRKPPTTTLVLLVRHGATATTGKELPGRAPGLHLSDVGRRQAEDVAARIMARMAPPPPAADRVEGNGGSPARRRRAKRPKIAAVYASPLERTRETAEPIAAAAGTEVVPDEGLLELDMGEWTGLELKAARKRREWATIQRYPSGFTFPGGESFLAMQARMVAALDRLHAAHPGETVVAVSHADPIRAAVNHAMGAHLDLFQRVVVSPCSVTALALGDEGPLVLSVNETAATGALVPS